MVTAADGLKLGALGILVFGLFKFSGNSISQSSVKQTLPVSTVDFSDTKSYFEKLSLDRYRSQLEKESRSLQSVLRKPFALDRRTADFVHGLRNVRNPTPAVYARYQQRNQQKERLNQIQTELDRIG